MKKYRNNVELNIFDIDGTLFNSDVKICVMKDGKVVKKLSSTEYNSYKLKTGESFSFDEFRCGKSFFHNSTPIEKMLDYASGVVRNQNHKSKSIIITAREDLDNKDIFLQKFREHNFPIDQVYVERAGNITKLNTRIAGHIAKGAVIRRYINNDKYDVVRMWDDHAKNLDMFVKVCSKYQDLKYEAYLVDPETGRQSRYATNA